MCIELTREELLGMRQFYKDKAMVWCLVTFCLFVIAAVIVVASGWHIEASSKFVYRVYLFFLVLLASCVVSSVKALLQLMRLACVCLDKFRVCHTERKKRFVNVSAAEVSCQTDKIFVKCVCSNYFIRTI